VNWQFGETQDMMKQRIACVFACAMLATSSFAQAPSAKSGGATKGGPGLMPGAEQWIDPPAAAMIGAPSVEIGGTLKLAILQGDPMTPGRSYVVRLSCTDGSKIAPHYHPVTENVTVIKGEFRLGMGSKWDDASMIGFPPGGFVTAPPKMNHYMGCKGDSIIQINGIAPLAVYFVGPDGKPTGTTN
jgi:quercetin dioxygenase-like cupin family protein